MALCPIIDARVADPFAYLSRRQITADAEITSTVATIIEDVRKRGDAALLDNGRRFDAPSLAGITLTDEGIRPPAGVAAGCIVPAPEGSPTDVLEERHLEALRIAAERIEQFHTLQLAHFTEGLTIQEPGFRWSHDHVGQRVLPLEKVGVYVPGGKATYPSSVLMNAIPARVAGVAHVFVATPARKDGRLAPAVIAALKIAGVEQTFKVGGAAAIAAFALGTESVPRVDKIVGPGNKYVNEAKRQLWGRVGLDGYAGPSEVCVLIDEHANAKWAAADLLTQIEHSEDNAGFIVSTSEGKLSQVLAAMETQLRGARAEETMRRALVAESTAFIAKDMSQAIDIVNAIAPEHLTISTEDPESVMEGVRNAGCILLGEYTPESAGDYVLGPSHTLPTAGAARFGSPVNILDFLKIQSVSNLTFDALVDLTPIIEAFGAMEGFPIHARGASIRLER